MNTVSLAAQAEAEKVGRLLESKTVPKPVREMAAGHPSYECSDDGCLCHGMYWDGVGTIPDPRYADLLAVVRWSFALVKSATPYGWESAPVGSLAGAFCVWLTHHAPEVGTRQQDDDAVDAQIADIMESIDPDLAAVQVVKAALEAQKEAARSPLPGMTFGLPASHVGMSLTDF